MRKVISLLVLFILVVNVMIPIYADDEIEENNITEEELHMFIETATNVVNIPTINSRNAIIFDRTSRRSFIWKSRKFKV